MNKMASRLMMLVLACALALPAFATNSDVAKEKRWAEQVIDGLLDGDEMWLKDPGGHEFLGILTEGDGGSGRAVILVHGIGVHPNWPDVIFPLREALLENDITSLSIQMPILPNEAEASEYEPLFGEAPGRFAAAVKYLNASGYRQISIVAHSMGTTMSSRYLTQVKNHGIDSFVAIGMGEGSSEASNAELLGQMDIDVLDLYGEQDLEPVRQNAGARAAAAGARQKGKFAQVEVAGAGHFFQGHEDSLKRQVIEWLQAR